MSNHRHLVLHEKELPSSAEWKPKINGWLGLRVEAGQGYWLKNTSASSEPSAHSLAVGDGFFVGGNLDGTLRASQLEALKIQYFTVLPRFLNGVITIAEEASFADILKNSVNPFVGFSTKDRLGQRFAGLAAQPDGESLAQRCACLQLWSEAVSSLLPQAPAIQEDDDQLRNRFRRFIGQFTEAELASHSLPELAGRFNCSERHISRLFSEEFGDSLRTRKVKLRLKRAQHLLAKRNIKIVHVALESGYPNIGSFNFTFKKHFGMTPSEWRRQKVFQR